MAGITEKEIRNKAIEHFFAECPARPRDIAFSEEEETIIQYFILELKMLMASKKKANEDYSREMVPVYEFYD